MLEWRESDVGDHFIAVSGRNKKKMASPDIVQPDSFEEVISALSIYCNILSHVWVIAVYFWAQVAICSLDTYSW